MMFQDLIGKGVEVLHTRLNQGFVTETGALSTAADADHDRSVTTDYIKGGCCLHVRTNSGYRVSRMSLYDAAGRTLAYNFGMRNYAGRYSGMATSHHTLSGRCWGMELPAGFVCRLEFVKLSQAPSSPYNNSQLSVITTDDEVIESFVRVLPTFFQRATQGYAYAARVRRRLSQHCFVSYALLADMAYNSVSRQRRGTTVLGVPYFNTREYEQRPGIDVSMRSFVSAWGNKRSLGYTENPSGNRSGYGRTYNASGDYKRGYWGTVCHGLVSAALGAGVGFDRIESGWKNICTLQDITTAAQCDNLRPLDLIIAIGNEHIAMVSDLWRDAEGNLRFIEVAEQSGYPNAVFVLYTPEEFVAYLDARTAAAAGNALRVYRLNNLNSSNAYIENTGAPEDTPWIPNYPEELVEPYPFNPDICTFAGDYASFQYGDDVYINVRRPDYNTSGTLAVFWFDPSSNGGEYVLDFTVPVDSTSHPKGDESEAEDIIDINITSNLSGHPAGKYKAVYTPMGGTAFEPTYFEIVKAKFFVCVRTNKPSTLCLLSLDNVKDGCIFTENSSYQHVGMTLPSKLDADKIATGEIVIGFNPESSSYPHLVLKAKGEYGNTVFQRISPTLKTNKMPATFGASGYRLNASGAKTSASGWGVTDFITAAPTHHYLIGFIMPNSGTSSMNDVVVAEYATNTDDDSTNPPTAHTLVSAANLAYGKHYVKRFSVNSGYIKVSVPTVAQSVTLVDLGPVQGATEEMVDNGQVEF